MKAVGLAWLLVSSLFLVGCESAKQQWRERVDATPVLSREFAGDYRAIYRAAQDAMKRIEFVVSRASLDDGVVAGHSRIQPGDPTRGARQLHLTVELDEKPSGMVGVSVVLAEQLEGGIGGAQERRVREHSLYESYLTMLQQVLNENLATEGTPRS